MTTPAFGDTSLPPRFWSKVERRGGCWIWTGCLNNKGYGRTWWNGGAIYAHRLTYIVLVGPVGDGLEVDHLCRAPACCHPVHLEAVSHAENCRRGTCAEVNRAAMATLTPHQALQVRQRRLAGERLLVLAKEFGVSVQTVCDIAKGRTWSP